MVESRDEVKQLEIVVLVHAGKGVKDQHEVSVASVGTSSGIEVA